MKNSRFKFTLFLVRDGKDHELSSITITMEKPFQLDRLEAWQWMLLKHNAYLGKDQFGYIKCSHFGIIIPVCLSSDLISKLSEIDLVKKYGLKMFYHYFHKK